MQEPRVEFSEVEAREVQMLSDEPAIFASILAGENPSFNYTNVKVGQAIHKFLPIPMAIRLHTKMAACPIPAEAFRADQMKLARGIKKYANNHFAFFVRNLYQSYKDKTKLEEQIRKRPAIELPPAKRVCCGMDIHDAWLRCPMCGKQRAEIALV